MPYEHQGIKAEVADVYMSIKDGLTDTEVMEMYPNEAYNVDKFERIRQRLKADENANIRRDVTVWYVWRKYTDYGKTRYVMDKYRLFKCLQSNRLQEPFRPVIKGKIFFV